MKNTTPRVMALRIAAITTIMSGIIIAGSSIMNFGNTLLISAFFLVLIFVLVYFNNYYYLNSFIFEKINPIYKTIHNINIPEKKLREDLEEKDSVNKIQYEVLDWAKNRAKEITRLQQLEKYRREFVGNVSHELKTPVFNIQGYVLTLLDGGLDDPMVNRMYLERTEKSVNRMISTINDLESISRLESGELKPDTRKFNIVQTFDEAFEINETMSKDHKIKLRFKNRPEKPLYVYGDKKQILDAVNNLIVNSIKYGNKNGKTTVDFLDMGENILIEIADDGIGISVKDLPRIFERFYRADKSRSREMGGTGLGLSIVKHIIEAHNQTINVRSKSGHGTSFAFTLKKA